MIDYDKLNEHLLEMAKNADGGIKLSAFMVDQLFLRNPCMKGLSMPLQNRKRKLKECHMLAKNRRRPKRIEEN